MEDDEADEHDEEDSHKPHVTARHVFFVLEAARSPEARRTP